MATPTGTPRPMMTTLDEASHLRDAAAALSTSQEVDGRASIPSGTIEARDQRFERRMGMVEGALSALLQSQARQLELASVQAQEQKANTNITWRGLRWSQVLAAFVALLPVVLSVWGEWLKAHPGASGGLTFGLLAALAAALGIGPTQGRAAPATVATAPGQQPPPSPS